MNISSSVIPPLKGGGSACDACRGGDSISWHDPTRCAARIDLPRCGGMAWARAARYLNTTGFFGSTHAISAIIFFTIAWPNELWFSATITNEPGPPVTLLR